MNKFLISIVRIVFQIVFYVAILIRFIFAVFDFCRWLAR